MGRLNRVSLSKSALLLSPCIAWAGPQAQWYDEEKVDTDDLSKRELGTRFHKAIQYIGVVHSDGHPDVEVWLTHARNYLDSVLLPRCESIQTEVCVGINWTTGEAEVFPEVKDRGYPDKPGWQFGTADLVCILKDGTLLIADWKTGGTDGAEEQLLSLACGFQKCMPDVDLDPLSGEDVTDPDHIKKADGWVSYRPVKILCLQVNDDGVWPHERDVPQQELDSHWDSMRFQWEDVCAGKRSTEQPGVHCTALYCPHLGHCKAIGAAVSDMAEQAPTSGVAPLVPVRALMRKVTDSPVSDTDAGDKMALISAANRQVKYATEQMKAYTKNGGRVICGQYEWSDGNTGFRWRKR